MELNAWTKSLRAVYDKAVSLYRDGKRNDATYFTGDEKSVLASVGLRPINVYDYAEDFVTFGEPDWETFLLIAAARRDYFLFEQKGLDQPGGNSRRPIAAEARHARWHPLAAANHPKSPLLSGRAHSAMTSCTAAAETATF